MMMEKGVDDRDLEAEVKRRLELPLDHWEPLDAPMEFTADASDFLEEVVAELGKGREPGAANQAPEDRR